MALSRFGELLGVWPRRLLALTCLLLAALSALHTDRARVATGTPSADVVVAAHDLAAGTVLRGNDLRVLAWPIALRPASAIDHPQTAVGRTLAGAIGAGEVLTSSAWRPGIWPLVLRPAWSRSRCRWSIPARPG